MSLAMALAVEMLALSPVSHRAEAMFSALGQAAGARGIAVHRTDTYTGRQPWLLIWGYGGRADIIARHVAAGGHVVIFDLGYWQRETKVRVSIDAPHPSACVMRRDWPRERFAHDGVSVTSDWRADGPVVVAGLGAKASRHYGPDVVAQWEADIAAQCRARWPTRPVIYRKKTHQAPAPAWASSVSCGTAVDHVLRGASLLVTWHSNVSVDAIRMGIPVVCQDGAAAAVCPSSLPETPAPLPSSVRDRFLGNLAWFQWRPDEAAQCWSWLSEMVS